MSSVDVVATPARDELDRIVRRWGELPLARAEARMPVLRSLLAELAARSPADGAEQVPEVPDLGPAVVMDQLLVLVWEAYAAGCGDGIHDLLTDLRRTLA